jgi:hypothetical protein
MLTEFFESPLRIREVRGGPFGPLLEGFAQELCRAGYARITARRHIRAAEHFSYWTDRKGIPVANLNESFVDRFGRHLDRCRCPRYGHSHLMDLGKQLRSQSCLPPSVSGCGNNEGAVMPRCTTTASRFGICSKPLETIRALLMLRAYGSLCLREVKHRGGLR